MHTNQLTLSTCCRPFLYRGELHLSYAIEIFDKSLTLSLHSHSDTHKMRFQGTGFARLNTSTMEMHSLAAFAQPLVPRREFPCCDKNWGVFEFANELYILYSILPCLTISKLDATQPAGAAFVYASCLQHGMERWLEGNTGLEMMSESAATPFSGHSTPTRCWCCCTTTGESMVGQSTGQCSCSLTRCGTPSL